MIEFEPPDTGLCIQKRASVVSRGRDQHLIASTLEPAHHDAVEEPRAGSEVVDQQAGPAVDRAGNIARETLVGLAVTPWRELALEGQPLRGDALRGEGGLPGSHDEILPCQPGGSTSTIESRLQISMTRRAGEPIGATSLSPICKVSKRAASEKRTRIPMLSM